MVVEAGGWERMVIWHGVRVGYGWGGCRSVYIGVIGVGKYLQSPCIEIGAEVPQPICCRKS